jgi:hypothetical protein
MQFQRRRMQTPAGVTVIATDQMLLPPPHSKLLSPLLFTGAWTGFTTKENSVYLECFPNVLICENKPPCHAGALISRRSGVCAQRGQDLRRASCLSLRGTQDLTFRNGETSGAPVAIAGVGVIFCVLCVTGLFVCSSLYTVTT